MLNITQKKELTATIASKRAPSGFSVDLISVLREFVATKCKANVDRMRSDWKIPEPF
jgi:hypothetical protein